ncbi:DUF1285 domain-containing protein [Neptuniibacter halophilus]|uniref:DUF1285 domain-containing protein n=1 Tax=Neptuniibacter halophilus TaxID=651666 RepID=UPI00257454FC|nr:DUF1285 domain-containing protein [Neptuniibacter halophilus]
MSKQGFDLGKASQAISQTGEGIPPLEKWNPDFCGDIDMRIARDGRWFYMGTPIGRQAMVNLFSRVLWLEEGRYFLKTPVEKVGIEVEDAPFLFTQLEQAEGESGPELIFVSTTGDRITAGPEQRLWVETCPQSGEPSPYLEVRFGMKGLIHRNLFYQLVEMAEPCAVDGREVLAIESCGERFILGALDD